ncbi:zinc-dependent alcohol dehydrogenase family protein [Roseivirga sp.]|uniref:zinc-dependent alcohol dehydrogenase family protein n=1 Tax=Roseivirga sp. TaxID=1964215 RepID=UPI003B8D7317
MKAVQFKQTGIPTEVLSVVDLPIPTPGPGEIRVKVAKANIIPADIMFIQGMYGIQPELPQIGGFEATGAVDACGDGVEMPIGTGVIFTATGTWSEYVCVAANSIIPKPPTMSDDVACQAFVNPLTAYGMLIEADLEEGDYLLITAAASAFSKFVIQIATSRGINVIGTVRRDEQKQALLDLGATAIINEKSENIYKAVKTATNGEMIKAAFDAVGGDLGDKVINALQMNGKMLVYGLLSLKPIPLNSGLLIFKNVTIKGFWLTTWFTSLSGDERRSIVPKILGMLTSETLKADVEATYNLDQIVDAIKHMEAPGRTGKILLDINS